MATLTANTAGVLTGKFLIPTGIRVGAKAVRATGASGKAAVATYTGRGQIRTEERRRVSTINTSGGPITMTNRIDPLSQTFTLADSRHLAGVDLWFATAGLNDVIVQIRDTQVGLPSSSVLAETRIPASAIQASGTATRVLFDTPVWLDSGIEYAMVVLTDSAVCALHVAELGKFDPTAQRWITGQPYQVGVLLSSSNASTWTAHQDRDLAFRLLGCRFSSTSRTLALGTVAVTNASDFIAEMSVDIPASGCSAELTATTPAGDVFRMAPDQPVQLPARVTGDVALALSMSGSATASPVLYPGVQFVSGDQEASGQYVSRAFPVGTAARINVTFEALTPGTSTIGCEIQKADGTWQTLTITSGVDAGDGFVERSYILTGFTATQTRVRLTLTGTTAARPRVRKLRAVATD